MNNSPRHKTVMIKEASKYVNLENGDTFLDATLGGGGHSKAILDKYDAINVIGIDKDIQAINIAQKNLKDYKNSISLHNIDFSKIDEVVKKNQIKNIGAILFDLGTSQIQLNDPKRGFSFQHESPLDMRMDSRQNTTADDIINNFKESDIIKILSDYGEERYSKTIARLIIAKRPIKNTGELSNLVLAAYKGKRNKKIHPATKVFQALRIAVNDELKMLEIALSKSIKLLKNPGGRLVVISFHSIEDRIVKQFFRNESINCLCDPKIILCSCNHQAKIKLISKKIIRPSEKEIEENPSSRSAKMRVAEVIKARKAS
ncbi:MAG: 16S rRNA (cytosine(1402)-N(4))-methyltransferase [Dehalococcoidaceae bacterium]|nr:16S rRNA (cytosine(1402)-N(4))-methyltransferase [Dehalococcoidaceae bacterium]|tara:strand:- start:27849 stop:28796 length:948 start_codon:yes stop_codon:yes gene_type:complete